MISFKQIESFYAKDCEIVITEGLGEALDFAREMSEFVHEVRAAFVHGCLLLRVLDDEAGDYYFPFPQPVTDGADVSMALREINEYATKEAIPEIITEVGIDDLPLVLNGVRHANVDAMYGEENIYTVSVKTECMLSKYVPDANEGRVYIGELSLDFYYSFIEESNIGTDTLHIRKNMGREQNCCLLSNS